MAKSVIKMIPLDKIFADCRLYKLFYSKRTETIDGESVVIYGAEVAHAAGEGPGYQRDPRSRKKWLETRAAMFDPTLCRPAEVSDRADGTFAMIDGGGRAWMALLAGETHIECRVHTGLSRDQEATLFTKFDSEVYKLRSVDTFIAMKAAGEPMAIAIADAAQPYQIAPSGSGTLKCVGPMVNMYLTYQPNFAAGLKLIKTTCHTAAAAWSGWTKTTPPKGTPIEAKVFMALGLFIDAAGSTLDRKALERVLAKASPRILAKATDASIEGVKQSTIEWAVTAATLLATGKKDHFTGYNKSFAGNADKKITTSKITGCDYFAALQEGGTYAALVRAERERLAKESEIEEEEGEDA